MRSRQDISGVQNIGSTRLTPGASPDTVELYRNDGGKPVDGGLITSHDPRGQGIARA